MYKEIIITIIIIGTVVATDILTQRYTENSVEKMNVELENLKSDILNDEQYNSITDSISKIENIWTDCQKKLVYYIEHDEIEKVTEQITEIRGYTEIDDVKESVPKIESCIFLLNHIEDKEKFNLKNLF